METKAHVLSLAAVIAREDTFTAVNILPTGAWHAAFQINQNLRAQPSPSPQTPALVGQARNASRHEVFLNAAVPQPFACSLVEPIP